jgi:hypothetical protein
LAASGYSFWILLFAGVPVTMSEQVHERAQEKEEVGHSEEHVSRMRPQQICAKSGKHEGKCEAEFGSEKNSESL